VNVLAPPLFTIGYERRTIGELLDVLVAADVARLVDVREFPLSRRRGFSKTALAEALAEGGIDYAHVKPLGNPRANRQRYRSGDVEGGVEVYRRQLYNTSYPALLELANSLNTQPTCLLCFERDHTSCHRSVIADSVRDLRPDVTVEHL
jgi:uncharacterized protein (DUF488 family)